MTFVANVIHCSTGACFRAATTASSGIVYDTLIPCKHDLRPYVQMIGKVALLSDLHSVVIRVLGLGGLWWTLNLFVIGY